MSGFPNMKVLQFAFSGDLKNPFLPKNYNRNCICYTGTHDNDTTLGWYEKAGKKEKMMFDRLVSEEEYNSPVFSLIAYGMKSKARNVIIPLQDYLQLPSSARINTPGVADGNWEWRFEPDDLTDDLANTVLNLSRGRN